ncbi:hypothetical protein H4Q26_006093 [Puccinia striiformis f. sp. tritici PST-130]|nr:hypothetical protein H4Q26_006093 [Puccinia striiformis f. sp. tritici PST-130]
MEISRVERMAGRILTRYSSFCSSNPIETIVTTLVSQSTHYTHSLKLTVFSSDYYHSSLLPTAPSYQTFRVLGHQPSTLDQHHHHQNFNLPIPANPATQLDTQQQQQPLATHYEPQDTATAIIDHQITPSQLGLLSPTTTSFPRITQPSSPPITQTTLNTLDQQPFPIQIKPSTHSDLVLKPMLQTIQSKYTNNKRVPKSKIMLHRIRSIHAQRPPTQSADHPSFPNQQHRLTIRTPTMARQFPRKLTPSIRTLSPGPTAAAREAHERLGEMRSIRWIAYAARAFLIRFWQLISKADSADIFIMVIAYCLMHLTFWNLFRNMAKLGSKFWLGALTVLSAIFAFILALITAHILGIRINPILLSEALPFLVITVGFDKPYILAPNEPVRPARDIVVGSISRVGVRIVRDYAIEITVLGLGAISGINGLTEFCQLAGLSLLYDCVLSFGFYISILTVFVEIHRIQVVRELAKNDSTTELSKLLDDGVVPSVEVVKEQMAEQESIRAKLIKCL